MSNSAKWNTGYIANSTGRVFKISELELKQVNSYLAHYKRNMHMSKVMLEKLYERASIIKGEPIDSEKPKRKILKTLKYNKEFTDSDRVRQIILLALQHLQQGAEHALIEAILIQARDDK